MVRHLFFVCLSFVLTSCGVEPAKFEPKAEPATSHSETDENEIKVMVEMNSDDSAVLDGKKYRVPEDLEDLRVLVESKRGTGKRYPVGIRAYEDVKAERVIAVIDELKKIDGVIIGLQSERLQR